MDSVQSISGHPVMIKLSEVAFLATIDTKAWVLRIVDKIQKMRTHCSDD